MQKKIKTDSKLKIKEKKLKKKAKNLNELVKGANTKRKVLTKNNTKFQMPVQGVIISDFGEGKDLEYTISVTELPNIEVTSLKNIKVDEYDVKIDPKEIGLKYPYLH